MDVSGAGALRAEPGAPLQGFRERSGHATLHDYPQCQTRAYRSAVELGSSHLKLGPLCPTPSGIQHLAMPTVCTAERLHYSLAG
jgi:hypothetical protein